MCPFRAGLDRLLKKAHLLRRLRCSSLQRTSKYASLLASSCLPAGTAPPCIWTFLNSLGIAVVFQHSVDSSIEIPHVNARHHLTAWASAAGRQPDIGHAEEITLGIVSNWVGPFKGAM